MAHVTIRIRLMVLAERVPPLPPPLFVIYKARLFYQFQIPDLNTHYGPLVIL